MYRNRILAAALLITVGISASLACGPFFSWQLLDDRTATLKSTPKNSFTFEVSHFVRPADHLKAIELNLYQTQADRDAMQTNAEVRGLTHPQADVLADMRRKDSGDAAYADVQKQYIPLFFIDFISIYGRLE